MSTNLFKITKYSHFFKCTHITPGGNVLIRQFAKRFIQHGMIRKPNGKFVYAGVRIYAASNRNRTEYRFHITTFTDFIRLLEDNYILPSHYVIEECPMYLPVQNVIEIKPEWSLRDYQVPVVDFIIKPPHINTRLVQLQTGRGKTLSFLFAAGKLGTRVVAVIKPAYIDKWVSDIVKTCNVRLDEIVTVSGSAELKALITLASEGLLEYKFILVANRTFLNWIKLYESVDVNSALDLGYDCVPEDFFEHVGAGIRLIDEVHQEAHGNFKIDMYTNVPIAVSLSATLENMDGFVESMYKVMCPMTDRFKEDFVDRYINATALTYTISRGVHYRTTEHGSRNYSHNAFEKSLIKVPKAMHAYFKMIRNTIDTTYLAEYKPGDKLAVFCSSIHMCTLLTKYLSDIYFNFDVRRYVEQDPYENIIEADIRITTILSGGTAIDIPGLTTVILTTSVMSVVSNKQTLGRLRKIEGRKTRFYYFVCTDIPKHLEYHRSKQEMLKSYALTCNELKYPVQIG